MNPLLDEPMNPPSHLRGELRNAGLALCAGWREFVFLHFTVPAEQLARSSPFRLQLFEGCAYASLVSFRMNGLRPARWVPPAIGRLLMRPFSDHQFLNLRAYVDGPAGPGILFLAEWIDSPWSLHFGPATYGLPYRLARISNGPLNGSGLRRISLHSRANGKTASLVVPGKPDTAPRPMARGSLEEFLLERYVAYTDRNGSKRWFQVDHPPWRAAPFDLARFNTALIDDAFPWFREAEFVGGHFAEGFAEVGMGAPQRIAVGTAEAALELSPAPAGR